MNIALIRPVDHDYEYVQWHEDVAIGYLCSILREAKLEYRVFDFALDGRFSEEARASVYREIADAGPSCVVWVIDKHPTNNPYYGLKSIIEMGETVEKNSCYAIYGNTQVSPAKFFDAPFLDYVILGEEECFLEFCDFAMGGFVGNTPEGIIHRDNGKPIRGNLPRTDIRKLPHPERYYLDHAKDGRHLVAAIQATRGCYAKCNFCYIRAKELVHGSYGWQARSPSDIALEISNIIETYGVTDFAFVDPQLIGPGKDGHDWISELTEEILSIGNDDIRFSIYARANDITAENIVKLKAAGLFAVFIGVESFSQKMLNRLKKGMTVERNLEAIKLLMDYNIHLRMGFISYDAETTMLEVMENCEGLKKILGWKPNLITQPVFFNTVLVPLDGTPLGDRYRHGDLIEPASSARDPVLANGLANEQMSRLNREMGATKIKDPKVRLLNEFTRVLASELVQRSTLIENVVSTTLSSREREVNSASSISVRLVRSWFDGLTSFAITQLLEGATKIDLSDTISIAFLDQLVYDLKQQIRGYDLKILGVEVPVWADSRLELVD